MSLIKKIKNFMFGLSREDKKELFFNHITYMKCGTYEICRVLKNGGEYHRSIQSKKIWQIRQLAEYRDKLNERIFTQEELAEFDFRFNDFAEIYRLTFRKVA